MADNNKKQKVRLAPGINFLDVKSFGPHTKVETVLVDRDQHALVIRFFNENPSIFEKLLKFRNKGRGGDNIMETSL